MISFTLPTALSVNCTICVLTPEFGDSLRFHYTGGPDRSLFNCFDAREGGKVAGKAEERKNPNIGRRQMNNTGRALRGGQRAAHGCPDRPEACLAGAIM